jgi:hypothetical protein
MPRRPPRFAASATTRCRAPRWQVRDRAALQYASGAARYSNVDSSSSAAAALHALMRQPQDMRDKDFAQWRHSCARRCVTNACCRCRQQRGARTYHACCAAALCYDAIRHAIDIEASDIRWRFLYASDEAFD